MSDVAATLCFEAKVLAEEEHKHRGAPLGAKHPHHEEPNLVKVREAQQQLQLRVDERGGARLPPQPSIDMTPTVWGLPRSCSRWDVSG